MRLAFWKKRSDCEIERTKPATVRKKVIQIRSSLLPSISKLDQTLYACIINKFCRLGRGGGG